MYKIQPKTVFLGKTSEYLPVCHSTNDYCQQLLAINEPENGFFVHADFQTKGRGQRGNNWEAIEGQNVLMSIILKPNFLKATDQFQLNMAVSLGILAAIKSIFQENEIHNNLKIKWPNDIYFENKKLGGILIENTILGSNLNYSIIGIGLNVNQLFFENRNAISVLQILNKAETINLNTVFEKILEQIEYYYLKLKSGENLEMEYLKSLFRIDEYHNFRKNEQIFTGKIIGIDVFGRLKIEVENEVQVFDFKEVGFVI